MSERTNTGGVKTFFRGKNHKSREISKEEKEEIRKAEKEAEKRKEREEKERLELIKRIREKTYQKRKLWSIIYVISALIFAIMGMFNPIYYIVSIVLGVCAFVCIYRAYRIWRKLK